MTYRAVIGMVVPAMIFVTALPCFKIFLSNRHFRLQCCYRTKGLKPTSIIAGASAVLQSRRLSTATTKTGAPSLWKNHKETLQGTRCPKPLSIMQGAVHAPYL